MIDSAQALIIINERLSANRVIHCQAVANVARKLAEQYGSDSEKAYITGLLHDIAKGISGKELLRLGQDQNLIHDPIDYMLPDLLHAPVGAWIVRNELGVYDSEITQAIACHTLGAVHMTALDKIIYLADMIEPGRDYPGRERLECIAYRDLDKAMLLGLDFTLQYCISEARIIHPQTTEARNSFLSTVKSIKKHKEDIDD